MAKILIGSELGSYSFNKAAKTITFSGFTASLERLLLITDTTNNTIIYQFNDPTKGGTLASNILTLTYNTTSGTFANTDKLQIFYWSEEPQQTALLDLAIGIKRDLQMMRREPNMTPGGLNTVVTSGNITVTSGTITTVSTVTNVSALNYLGASGDGIYSSFPYYVQTRDAFNTYKSKIIS